MDLLETIQLQAGVVSRRQALECGDADHDIRRRVRRREWATVHAGVYVDHTGPLTWMQRAWAAVLFAWPSGLSHRSALWAAEWPRGRVDADAPIHVVVDHRRTVTQPVGVRVHRRRDLSSVLWDLGPPRVRYADAVLDVALDADGDLPALGVLAAACQSRRTSADRLLRTLADRKRVARRRWLADVLHDVAEGTCSVLEHEYLSRVERRHRLPRGERQRRATTSTSVVYRDVEYADSLIVELDGRLFHNTAGQRDRDFERDLDAAVDARETLRLSWGQVHERGCSTAAKVALVLRRRGWTGTPSGCGPGCPVEALFGRRTA